MAIKPEVLDALLAAGATAEMIVAAVKADASVDAAHVQARTTLKRIAQAHAKGRSGNR